MGQFITPDVLPPDTFCRRLLIPNDPKWIGAVSGALIVMIYASEWESYGGITPDEAAARSKVMLDDFWASNGCGEDMNCCDDQVRIKRINPVTGRPQISLDNGVTWQPDPADTQNNIQLLPPIVKEGSSNTQCDAATNASEHINELITATGENLTTASTIFALAVGIAEAILGLFLILISAGTLTAPVTAVATAIWAAATSLFSLGISAYNSYWTVDKQDAILCALYCTIGANGQFTEAQYQEFRTKILGQLPASPALDIVMTSINVGGATGLSQMASYGNAALADCSSCVCDECDPLNWDVPAGHPELGIVLGYGDGYVDIQAGLNSDGRYYLVAQSVNVDTCCQIQSAETLSGTFTNYVSGYNYCGETATIGVPNHVGNPETFGCGNYFQYSSTTAFTWRIRFEACP
jgi:hypothetical protein